MAHDRKVIRVGARGSLLSRTQAEQVLEKLKIIHPDFDFEFQAIRTSGDEPSNLPLGDMGVKGLFVKEIEAALLSGRIDLAIHSAKDLAMEMPYGLMLGPAPKRLEPWDVLVCDSGFTLETLPRNSMIGTSSLRRTNFLLCRRPDLVIRPLRGNVETRLSKVGKEFRGIVLAKAAMIRLGLDKNMPSGLHMYDIPWQLMMPSPGQGQLALQYRGQDMELRRMLTPLEHWPSTLSMLAERAAMRKLGLGCTAPVGAYAHFSESRAEVTGEPLLILTVLLMEPVHRSYMKIEKYTSDLTPEGAMKLGQQAIGALIADGGGDMLLKYFNHIHPDYRPHFPHDPNLNN